MYVSPGPTWEISVKHVKETFKIHWEWDRVAQRQHVREVAGSNPAAVSPILCPWERHFTRLSSLYSGENEYLASVRDVPRIER